MTELRRQDRWQSVFLTLKDPADGACLGVTMPRGQFDALRLELANGERVHVFGRPELFEARGDFRLRALSIERFGLGEHLAALERLKQKLAAEGLFAAERKRPLPRLPRRIGLVTGNDAAAKRDVLTAITARFPPARILVAETYVQGPRAAGRDHRGAPSDLRRAGDRRRRPRPRRRQLRGPAPVQRRAPRPRARGLPRADRLRGRPRAGHAALRPRRRRARLDADGGRAARRPRPGRAHAHGSTARGRPSRAGPAAHLERERRRLDGARDHLRRAPMLMLERRRAALEHSAGRLRALSPRATLERGYAIVRSEDEIVRSSSQVGAGAKVDVELGSGSLRRPGRGDAVSEPTFEEAQRELETIVQRLESGDASLDEAITLWERGEELYRVCSAKLDAAQGGSRSSRSASKRSSPGNASQA